MISRSWPIFLNLNIYIYNYKTPFLIGVASIRIQKMRTQPAAHGVGFLLISCIFFRLKRRFIFLEVNRELLFTLGRFRHPWAGMRRPTGCNMSGGDQMALVVMMIADAGTQEGSWKAGTWRSLAEWRVLEVHQKCAFIYNASAWNGLRKNKSAISL